MRARTKDFLRRERMETTLDTLVELFAATKQTEGKSPKTVSWYRQMLSRLSRWAGPQTPISQLSLDLARAFVANLQSKQKRYADHPSRPTEEGGLSPMTIHGYVRSLKAFSSWLVEEGYTRVDIFKRLKRPKVPKTVIEVLTDEEIKTIFGTINPNCLLGLRLYTVVSLLLDTGIRAKELCSLKLGDTHLEQSRIKVWGKGSKERYVPIGATLKKTLLHYISAGRFPLHEGIEELILSDQGTPLTYSGLSQMIRRLGNKVGIPRLRCHW